MSAPSLSRACLPALLLALASACSGGDLTLPGGQEPAAVQAVSGDGQQAEPGALLPDPLVARVLDGEGRPLQGVRVEFGFLGDLPGAGLDPTLALTDSDGQVSAVARLGETSGGQLIVASVAESESAALRARFLATALAGGGGGDEGGGDGDDGDGDGDGGGEDDPGEGGGDGGDDGEDDGDDGDDAADGIGPPPDPLGIPSGHYPPLGSCRVWIQDRAPGQQAEPQDCDAAVREAPAGVWVLYRPASAPAEIHVRVIHPERGGEVVRVWVYDAGTGRFLR